MEQLIQIMDKLPKKKLCLYAFIAGMAVMAVISFLLHRTNPENEGKTYEQGYSDGYAVGFDEGFYAAEDEIEE